MNLRIEGAVPECASFYFEICNPDYDGDLCVEGQAWDDGDVVFEQDGSKLVVNIEDLEELVESYKRWWHRRDRHLLSEEGGAGC